MHGFPAELPEAVTLLDVGERTLRTFIGDDLARVGEAISSHDVIVAVGVRPLLRRLGVDPGRRRLHEIGPPQETTTLDRRGRKLRLTTELLIKGTCQIGKPLGEPDTLRRYLREGGGQLTRLRRRLESDAKSLLAYYNYGRLHRCVRVRWGHLDVTLPAPWAEREEPSLYALMKQAREEDRVIEAVVGPAPSWSDPWSRLRALRVLPAERGPWDSLIDEAGYIVEPIDVQAARLR